MEKYYATIVAAEKDLGGLTVHEITDLLCDNHEDLSVEQARLIARTYRLEND